MDSRPKISVIVPAYNAELFIKRALDSVRNQTFQEFEVIIINDGSRDTTERIAREYESKDKRFHLISQKNQGVSAARQKGLDASIGEYTIHLDADDWMEPHMLEVLYNKAIAEQADMVICDYYEHRKDRTRIVSQPIKSLDHITLWGEMLFDLNGFLWNKLIKRDAYLEHNIRFINDMKACEDLYVVLRILSHRINISFVPLALYHYDRTQNDQSLMTTITAGQRMRPLELVAKQEDISPIIEKYNSAVFLLAYKYLFYPTNDYRETFRKYEKTILKAKQFPLRNRLMIIMELHHINLPIKIARFIKRL